MFHLRAAALALTLAVTAPFAASADEAMANRLLDAMGIDGIIAIMRQEGLNYGDELAAQAVAGGVSDGWGAAIDRIYDTGRMTATVRAGFVAEMGDVDLTPLVDFFESEGGQELIALELSAREAMTDDAVEEAAKDVFRAMDEAEEKSDRFRQIEAFVEVNDLIEANVVGALNSNIVFYRGLADGGASDLTDEDILRDVWAQEDETRADTREWVYGFLMLAYKPLADEVLDAYIALSDTEAGVVLNRGLFAGFDRMYTDISYALGLALAREMQVEEL